MPTLRNLYKYPQPSDLEEALSLLQGPQIGSVPLAGGPCLVPEASHNVQAVIDLAALNLAYIRVETGVVIGAMTTLQTIAENEHLRDYADGLLVKAVLDSAAHNVRDAATLGGSIVSAVGASPLLTALLALDAKLTLRGDQEGEIDLSDWANPAHTLILQIDLPALSDDTHAAYEKVARTPADLPIVCVAARATVTAGQLSEVRVAIGGVGEKPALVESNEIAPEAAAQLALESIDPPSDYFASSEYRREMTNVLVKRALTNLSR